jgi:hypothetical protein
MPRPFLLEGSRLPEGHLTLAPPAWHHPDFWDEVFDGVPAALEVFEKEKDLVLVEA